MIGLEIDAIAWALMAVLCVVIALTAWRMLRGPAPADRFVAFDMLTAVAVAYAALVAVVTGRAAFLDVALALSLVNFVATAAFALFLEHRKRP